MQRFTLALLFATLLGAPATASMAQTMPVPAPRTAVSCTPRRDAFFPAVIATGATCSGVITSPSVDSVMHKAGDVWLFDGYQNTCVEITVRSRDFDAAVEAGLWVGTWYYPVQAQDDDSGGGTDARARLIIRQNGSYYINVLPSPSAWGARTGAYTLSVTSAVC